MRKTKLFSAAVLCMAWLAGGSAQAWDEPAQDADGVWQIGTASELEWFSEYVESLNGTTFVNAVLTADLDFKDITHKPIGSDDQHKFWGTFDGQGHCIKNMTAFSLENPVGLFGGLREYGDVSTKVSNVIIDSSCQFTGKNYVGAIAGYTQNGQGNNVGQAVVIENCVNKAGVQATNGAASGILGACKNNYAKLVMTNCVNMGKVQGTSTATALSGWINNSDGTYTNCYNIGEITCSTTTGNGTYNMTVFGSNGGTRRLVNCYDLNVNNNRVQGKKEDWSTADPVSSGELCFYLNDKTNGGTNFYQTIGDDLFPMPFSTSEKVYEVADYYCDGTPKGSVVYSNTEGGTKDEHVKGDNYICVNCHNYAFDGIENYKTPDADGWYHLSTVDDVEWFSAMVNKKYHGAMNVVLDNDIDFGSEADIHTPIGTSAHKFFGKFNGQGHRIKGLILTTATTERLENRDYDGMGFFGSVRGGGTDADGTVNNEVVIENLIIDASCSFTHGSKFAAAVVGHINSRNDENSKITIQNCGNEANVTAGGVNAAGILGCVEATNVGLVLHNLWNKGNITGTNESAAICAWTGQRNVDGEVDVEGCWNIGEVTGIDGNGYNLIRRNSSIVPRNIVDLCLTNGGNQGKVSVLNTADPISSGELCYLLNGDQSEIVYTQDLGTDEMPVYRDDTHKQVYQAGTVDCLGASVGTINYNNVSGETVVLPHNINDEIGMCDICYTQFQEPAKDGDYYLLKNAGNVEWLSGEVANGGGKAFYARMENDIDFLGMENLHSPIGPTTGSKFKGVFDGQGHRVKNMIINQPTKEAQGFFGWLQGNDNTTIVNLIIDKSCSIIGSTKCGGVAGASQNSSATAKITIENVVNEADVTVSGQDAAGIVGGESGEKATYYIHNVVNTGTITSTHQYPYAGALFCYQEKGTVENFLNLGKIVGHDGGNIGRFGDVNAWVNVIDLSETEDKTQAVRDDLTAEDVVNGKVAYILGFKQLIGTDEYPSPLNETEVSYVGDAGYATLYDTTTGYELKGDAKAYAVTTESTWLKLTEVENVPASTPVVLKGSYYNKLAADLPALTVANELKGTDAATEADGTMYVLAKPEGADKAGFYKADGTIPAGKAYYQSTSGVKAFFFEEDDATALNGLNDLKDSDDLIFNLAGQRISKMQKGINIVGGKKMLK